MGKLDELIQTSLPKNRWQFLESAYKVSAPAGPDAVVLDVPVEHWGWENGPIWGENLFKTDQKKSK